MGVRLTSTALFFLVTLFLSSLSGSGVARLTGGLRKEPGLCDVCVCVTFVFVLQVSRTCHQGACLCAGGVAWFLTCS